MSQWKKITIRVMRYVTLLLIVGFVALLLIYTSGSNRPFEKVEKSVEASLDKENMKRQDGTALKRNFGLNAADYDGVMYYSSEFSISSEEVLLIKAKSETQTAEISSAIEERIKTRMNDFEGYAPESVQLLEDAKKSVRGKYVFLPLRREQKNIWKYLTTVYKSGEGTGGCYLAVSHFCLCFCQS